MSDRERDPKAGTNPKEKRQPVVGSDVPRLTGVKLGDDIRVAHDAGGDGGGEEHHEQWKVVGVCVDITVQKQREQDIRWLNDRLRVSVQETHHRVKNNLQLIAAMLDMASSEYTDSLTTPVVKRIMQQVLTLASLHDMLTGSVIATDDARGLVSMKVALGRLLGLLGETGHFTI